MSIRDGIAKSLRWLAAKTATTPAPTTLQQARQAYCDAVASGDANEILRTRAEYRAAKTLRKP